MVMVGAVTDLLEKTGARWLGGTQRGARLLRDPAAAGVTGWYFEAAGRRGGFARGLDCVKADFPCFLGEGQAGPRTYAPRNQRRRRPPCEPAIIHPAVPPPPQARTPLRSTS
jgi:hypothetical protein